MRASEPRRLRGATLLVSALLALTLPAGGALAQANDREQEQLRRLRLQVQQLQQEKSQAQDQAARAQAEKAQLGDELKKLQAAAGGQRSSAAAAARQATALEQDLAAARAEHETIRAELDKAAQELARLRELLPQREAELARRADTLRTRDESLARAEGEGQRQALQLDICADNNASLVRIGTDLSDMLARVGLFDRIAATEPFLQLRRVQLENLSQTWRDRAEAQRFNPAAAGDGKARP